MQKTKNYVSVVFVSAVVFWSGCDHNGIIIEYHIPSKLSKLVITVDETNGQNGVHVRDCNFHAAITGDEFSFRE